MHDPKSDNDDHFDMNFGVDRLHANMGVMKEMAPFIRDGAAPHRCDHPKGYSGAFPRSYHVPGKRLYEVCTITGMENM